MMSDEYRRADSDGVDKKREDGWLIVERWTEVDIRTEVQCEGRESEL